MRRRWSTLASASPRTTTPARGGRRGGAWSGRLLEVEERAQLLRSARVAQLAQGLGLDLADALAGDVELLADFLEGVVGVHVDAEAHAQHLRLPRGEAGEHVAHGLHQAGLGRRLARRGGVGVLDEVA